MQFDTIVAPITGNPPAAVVWIRLSGPDAWAITSQIFSHWPSPVAPRIAQYGRFIWGDDGLALPFPEGHSYTGEDSVELSMHGSRASLLAAMEACVSAGARMAEPGEFTQRAFLNGRIDLTQAEAVRETIDALTESQLKQANRNREGALRDEIRAIRREIIRWLAAVEASVDFSEEIGEVDRPGLTASMLDIQHRLTRLASTAQVSKIVRDGYRIAIVGPPNAGKSSLLNRLLGSERAIVTAIPGTTRDFVEERADFDGVPVVLIDTAGLRETDDLAEGIGIERALTQAKQADTVWFVYDAQTGLPADIETQRASLGENIEFIANKCDLGPATGPGAAVSALTGEGIADLVAKVRSRVLDHAPAIAVNERQSNFIDDARRTIGDLLNSLDHDSPDDLLSVLLNETLASLGKITGDTVDADVLTQIFRDFCVGK